MKRLWGWISDKVTKAIAKRYLVKADSHLKWAVFYYQNFPPDSFGRELAGLHERYSSVLFDLALAFFKHESQEGETQ